MENKTINTKSLTRSMSSLRRSLKDMGKGSRYTVLAIQALQKAMEKAGKSSNKLRRALASFDQLNRLVAPGGTVGKVNELTESIENLQAVAAKPLNIVSMDNMPGILSGVTDKLNLVGEALLQGNFNLAEHSELWKHIKIPIQDSTGALGEFYGQTLTLEQVVNLARGQLGTMSADFGSTAGAALQLGAGILDIGNQSQAGVNGAMSAWGNFPGWIESAVRLPVQTTVAGMYQGFTAESQAAWDATVQVFSQAGGFFESTFSGAWSRVKAVFSNSGPVFEGIKAGVLGGFKTRVNALIDGINQVVPDSFNGINAALNRLRTIRIGGQLPFSILKWNSAIPRIPHLAQGAVLPANKPFMAVVGDQRHGTNVEAPLETITEAVRIAMEDLQNGNLSGHRATVELLGRILEAVRNIRLTDGQIAEANRRYEQKQAIMYGI